MRYLARPQDGRYFSGVFSTDDGETANCNGLLASVQHRFSQGFTLLANYTWSHCLNYGDINGTISTGYYQDDRTRAPNYGSCAWDIRHMFNTTMVVLSPFKGNGWAGRVLGNWKLAPLVRATTGLAINETSGRDNSLTAVGRDRPNPVLANPYPETRRPSQWINLAAFVPNPAGTFGTLGRKALRAPGGRGAKPGVSGEGKAAVGGARRRLQHNRSREFERAEHESEFGQLRTDHQRRRPAHPPVCVEAAFLNIGLGEGTWRLGVR